MSIFLIAFSILMGAIAFGTMIYMFNKQGKSYNGRLLGVMLPANVHSEPEVLKITTSFKKSWHGCIAVFAFLYLPCLVFPIISKVVSIITLYLLFWFVAFILICSFVPLAQANKRLMELKHHNGWYCGSTHSRTVCVDTEASRLKNKKNASVWLIVLAVAIDIAAFIFLQFFDSRVMHTNIVIAFALSLVIKAVCLWLYYHTLHLRVKTFSQDTQINISANIKRQRVWTWVWVLFALTDSVCFALSWALMGIKGIGIQLFMAVTGFEVIAVVIIAFSAIAMLNRFITAVTNQDEAPVITDDDDYWKWGIIYCNPNDSSTMVEKRLGTGFTLNFGNAKGKALGLILIGIGAVVLIGVSTLLLTYVLPLEMSVPVISVTDSKVNINYHEYSKQFSADDIKSVSLLESIPDSTRTNGIGTGEYSRGYYNVDGYGCVMLYVYNSAPPYILVALKNGDVVIYNENTRDKTMKVYNELKEMK